MELYWTTKKRPEKPPSGQPKIKRQNKKEPPKTANKIWPKGTGINLNQTLYNEKQLCLRTPRTNVSVSHQNYSQI